LISFLALCGFISAEGSSVDVACYCLIQHEVIYSFLYIYRFQIFFPTFRKSNWLFIFRNWFNLPLPYKCEQCRQELVELFRLLLLNVPIGYNPSLETAITIFTQAYQVDKAYSIRNLLSNCIDLINLIMSSRICTSISTSTILPLVSDTDGAKSNPDKTPLTSHNSISDIYIGDCNSDSNLGLKLPSEQNTAMELGIKRKNDDDEPSLKITMIQETAIEERDKEEEIIFDGEFCKKKSNPKLIPHNNIPNVSNWANVSNSLADNISAISINIPPILEHPEKNFERESLSDQISQEANDALSYFVDNRMATFPQRISRSNK